MLLHLGGLGSGPAAIPISYRGLAADEHVVDAQQYGRSIAGIAKIANSIGHLILSDQVSADQRAYIVRFYVGPSRENGLLQELFAVLNTGHLPFFSSIFEKLGLKLIEKFLDAVINAKLGKSKDRDKSVEVIHDLSMEHAGFSTEVHRAHMQDKQWLQGVVDKLVEVNRAPLRDVPEPIGKSVRYIQVGRDKEGPLLDEPAAEVLRAREPMTVGDEREYEVKIAGVFKTNGLCKIKFPGDERIISGKITDPALGSPGNVYTQALNTDARLRVTAKPTMKDGKLHRLFISNADISRL